MSMMVFLDVLHLGGGEIAKRVVLRAEVFHESYKFVVLHFQLLLVNRPLSALSSRFQFTRLPSLHRLDHGFDELLLGLGDAVFSVELVVDFGNRTRPADSKSMPRTYHAITPYFRSIACLRAGAESMTAFALAISASYLTTSATMRFCSERGGTGIL